MVCLKNIFSMGKILFDTILTKNVKDFKNSEIGAFSPKDYLKTRK